MTASTAANIASARCPVCCGRQVSDCIQIPQVPVYCNVLHATRQEALNAPRGDIDLCFCRDCGHLFNRSFDPARVDYALEYENSLHYSGRFREYALSLAQNLIERHDLRHKTVIEIACGKGDFLELLCRLGRNRGIGFDPNHAPGRQQENAATELTFIRDYYGDTYRDYRADLVCCRHALEHIGSPGDFLRALHKAIGDHPSALYFEVPNALFTLRDLAIWDLIYEHCGYFTEHSLREVFRRSGFAVTATGPEFGGQFLALHGFAGGSEGAGEAQASDSPLVEPPPAVLPAELPGMVRRFAGHYRAKVENWRHILQGLRREGCKTVLWGAGSKGVSFANSLQAGEAIDCLVDLNPNKQGRYIAGTGHRIHTPESLTQIRPDAVIVMNPLYTDEIRRQLGGMGLDPRIVEDLPPAMRTSP